MEIENLEFESKLGKPAIYTFRSHRGGSRFLTILLPGQAYYKDAPLMWYSALAAFQAGTDTLNVEYNFQANRNSPGKFTLGSTLVELRSSLESFLSNHEYETIIMISKSIGTHFASEMGKIGNQVIKRHIFLTPLKSTIEFMKDTPEMLVMVGEKDPLFGEEDVNKVRGIRNVLAITFPDADHLMEVRDDYNASLRILEQVARECGTFVSDCIRRRI